MIVIAKKSKFTLKDNAILSQRFSYSSFEYNIKTFGWVAVYVLAMIVLCILLSTPLILIPQHDVITYPKYWYEPFIVINMSYSLAIAFKTMIECKMILKLDSTMNLKFFLKFYAVIVSLITIPGLIYQLIWVIIGNEFPTPLTGFIGYIGFLVSQIMIWFVISNDERLKDGFAKRFRAYILFKLVMSLFTDLQKDVITIGFKKINLEYQWIFAFVLPLVRQGNTLLLHKILHKLGDLEDVESKTVTNIHVNVGHAMYIAVQLGTSASQPTAYCILGVEFLINIWTTFKIVRLHQKITPIQNTMRKRIEERMINEQLTLTLVELIEVLVPLAYICVTLIAYNGPNYNIIGNIGSSMWQFKKIENLNQVLFVGIEMFVFDTMSCVFAGVILWKFCSINLLLQVFDVIKKFGYFISLQLSVALIAVSQKYICTHLWKLIYFQLWIKI